MKASNHKNSLQEYYQKRGETRLPRYEHTRAGDRWESTLFLPDQLENFLGFGHTKKEADQDAAGNALRFLGNGAHHEPTVKYTKNRSLILIDLENSPACTSRTVWAGPRIEAFVGMLSSHALNGVGNLTKTYPFVTQFHIVQSGYKDAVDHAISVRAGEWLVDAKGTDGLIIVSRDRFALALVDVIRNLLDEADPLEVKHYVTMDECFSEL